MTFAGLHISQDVNSVLQNNYNKVLFSEKKWLCFGEISKLNTKIFLKQNKNLNGLELSGERSLSDSPRVHRLIVLSTAMQAANQIRVQ